MEERKDRRYEEQVKETSVLSDEEKHHFDGITIDEETQETYEEPSRSTIDEAWYQSRGTEDLPGVKIYTLSGMSLLTKILIGLAIIGILVALFFLGWVFFVGFVIVTIIGAIWSMIKRLL